MSASAVSGGDDTGIAPLSTSVEVDDQGNVITTGQGSNTLTGIDAALALAKHYVLISVSCMSVLRTKVIAIAWVDPCAH